MVARNDITGDAIQTKTATQSYRDNYDLIFRKKIEEVSKLVAEETLQDTEITDHSKEGQ